MANGVLIALIGLVAALIGGAIQAFATGKFEASKFEHQAKWELYTSYFVTLGELTFRIEEDEKYSDAMAAMAQIRGRIGIYGSPDVISAVGNVFHFESLVGQDAQDAMTVALEAMRKDIGKKDTLVTREMLKQVMFGSRPSLR